LLAWREIMNVLRLLAAASSTIALLSGCTSPAPSETVGTGSSGGGGSSGSVGSSASVGGSGPVGASWAAAQDRVFANLALASAGKAGALAYVESPDLSSGGAGESVIKLQRIDTTGARVGEALSLGHVTSKTAPRVTVASDGSRYLVCWDDPGATQIACALAPVAEGPSVPALSVAGLSPSLVYSAGAWTLAYGVPGNVAVAHVAGDGSTLGGPALFAVAQALPPRALLAATPAGFALVSAPEFESGQDVFVHLLDSAFQPLGAAIDLGMKLWLRHAAAIVVNGSKIAVSVSEPYGSHFFVLEGGAVTSSRFIDGGGKVGPVVALTVDGAAFGRLGQDDSPAPLTYTTIVGDVLVVAPQTPQAAHGLPFFECIFDVLPIGEGQLLATTAGYHNDEIVVAGVQRP
jgi:hypothetical protein